MKEDIISIQNENNRKRRLKELLEEPLVKEFLELSKLDFNEDLSIKEEIINNNLNKLVEDDKNVYLCEGYDYNGISEDGAYVLDFMGFSYNSTKCALYRNIDNEQDIYVIPVSECREFENSHYVLHNQKYYNIHIEYVISSFTEGKDRALTRIKRKYE